MMTTKVFQRVLAIFLVVAAIFLANGVAQAGYIEDMTPYWQDEVKKYTLAIQKNPNDYEAYIKRAQHYGYLEQYNKAIADFNKAIQLNPNNYEAYKELAELYSDDLKQYEKSIPYYSKAIQFYPYDDYRLYKDRALVYGAIGQYEKAISDYSKCIKYDPDDDLYILRGNMYLGLAKYNDAFKDFNNAVAYLERSKKEYFDFLERRGEPKKFPASSEGNLAEAYLGRASCYFILGDRKKAVQDYTKSIQSYSSIQNDMFSQVFEYKEKLAQAYYGRGMAYQTLGETAKAQADLAKAKQLASNG